MCYEQKRRTAINIIFFSIDYNKNIYKLFRINIFLQLPNKRGCLKKLILYWLPISGNQFPLVWHEPSQECSAFRLRPSSICQCIATTWRQRTLLLLYTLYLPMCTSNTHFYIKYQMSFINKGCNLIKNNCQEKRV